MATTENGVTVVPVFSPFLARLARYSILVLVAFGLLWAASWQGLVPGGDRQYIWRQPNPHDIALPHGYQAEVVATGLNAPSALEIAPDGTIFIGESGYGGAYAATAGYEGTTPGRILRLNRDGTLFLVAGGFRAPLSGFVYDRGAFYVSHLGTVTAVTPAGRRDILTGLPSLGDHKNNEIALGPDGKLYFGQGTATNSGVVGLDNWMLWGRFFPGVKDIPCQSVTMAGVNYRRGDPRSVLPLFFGVKTGAFSPFGHITRPGQVISGQLPCNGAIMRVNRDGSGLELVASGMRNPFGVRFGADGQLYVTDNGFDPRGSRPLHGHDLLHRVKPGAWYGWPDYWNGEAVTKHHGNEEQKLLLAKLPATPEKAWLTMEEHVAAAGFDFAPAGFGFAGQIFVAQWGSGFPATSQKAEPRGFRVVRVDPASGKVQPFAVNRRPGPASLYEDVRGFERPVSVRFGPDGAMYVLDWGHLSVTKKGPYHVPYGGVLWRIRRVNGAQLPYPPVDARAVLRWMDDTREPVHQPTDAWPRVDARSVLAGCVLIFAGWRLWLRKGT